LRTITIKGVKDMGQVNADALQGRDAAIWADWCAGMRQVDIAAKRGIPQQTISDAVNRYAASIPPEEKRAFRERCLERYERLYLAHAQAGEERPRVAAIVRGIIDSEARLLGLVQSNVHVEHDGMVQHQHDPGPTVAELLEQWRREGKLRTTAELVRLDQEQGP
jgi:hypothetical protein